MQPCLSAPRVFAMKDFILAFAVVFMLVLRNLTALLVFAGLRSERPFTYQFVHI